MDDNQEYLKKTKERDKQNELLNEYENKRFLENDPRQKRRWEDEINNIKQTIEKLGEEIKQIEQRKNKNKESGQETIFMHSEECPYRGLQAFEEEHAKFFFGRKKVVDSIQKKLEQANFILIIGSSGSGKSSVVLAGLIPKLKESGWKILRPITPGYKPLRKLEGAFQENFKGATKEKRLENLIYNEPNRLSDIIEKLPGSEKHLLVVDQFEEVFTGGANQREKQRFIDLLTQVVDITNSRLAVVITMRADFLGHCWDYSSLYELITLGQSILPLTGVDLNDIITKPAERQHYSVAKALELTITEDVKQELGFLPLLEFVLTKLWDKRDQEKRQLTLEQYEKLGRLTGALNLHAQKVYDYEYFEEESPTKKRNEDEKKWIKLIFFELIQPGEGEKDTRKRQLKATLLNIVKSEPDEKQRRFRKLLDEEEGLVKGRLLVTGKDEKGEAWIDLAHEALIEGWTQLVEWRKENRDLRRLKQKLEVARQEWINKGKDDEYLMQRGLLAEVRGRWEELQSYFKLSDDDKTFYQRSDASNEDYITKLESALTQSQLREKAARVQNLIPTQPLDALLLAVEAVKTNLDWISNSNKDEQSLKKLIAIDTDTLANKPGEILGVVQASLYEAASKAIAPNVCEGHQAAINSIAFISKEEIIVGDSQNMVYFWDSSGKKMRREPLRLGTNKSYSVNSIAFSSKLKKILSGCFDGKILIWNFDGKLLHTLEGHTGTVNAVAFSPDGEMIVSTSSDHTLRLWNIKTGESIGEPFDGHTDSVNAVAFNPTNGKMIASGGKDKTILLWNISDQSIKPIALHGHEDCVHSIAFSPDGKTIASGSEDKTIRLWTIEDSPIGQPLRGHTNTVYSVAFSPDGQMVVSGSKDTTVRLWTIEGSPIGQPLHGHDKETIVYSVAFSPDGQMVVSGGQDKKIILWAITNHNPILELCKHTDTVNAIAFSHDGEMIVSASSDHTLCLWNTETGESIGEALGGHDQSVNAVAFNPNDTEMIVSASSDHTLRLWNTKTGKSIGEPLCRHEDVVSAVAFSSKGLIVSGSFDSRICLWNDQGKYISQVPHKTGCQISSVAFSPNGEMIVSGTSNGQLYLWKINDNSIELVPPWPMILREEVKHKVVDIGVSCVAFSPNGEMIVGSTSNGELYLWNLKGDDFEDTEPWVAHPDENDVQCAFSPDGQMIVSGGSKGVIRLWDIKGNRIGETSKQHKDIITSIAFSPNGKWIATGSADQKIYLWRGGWREEWLKICCERLAPIIFKQPLKDMNESCEICVRYNFWDPTDFATILKKQGEFWANSLQEKEAQDKFIQVKKYEFDFKFESKELEKQILNKKLNQLPTLERTRKGEIRKVIESLRRIDPTLELFTPSNYNELCWFGSLYECQDDDTVMAACEKAVKLDPENGSFRESRGVAKALRSMKTLEEKDRNIEIEQAIEDFNACIADEKIDDEDQKQRCQQWIGDLRSGKNPFTEDVIKNLLDT